MQFGIYGVICCLLASAAALMISQTGTLMSQILWEAGLFVIVSAAACLLFRNLYRFVIKR